MLAELGAFWGLPAAALMLLLGGVVAFVLLRDLRRRAAIARPRALELAAAAGLLLVGLGILARPHEYVLGGLDPGVYVNAAIHIGKTGSVVWWDADVAALSPTARAALFREPPAPFSEGSRFIGFYFGGLEQGRVVPHGLHLLSAAMAVGYVLGGLPGLFLVPPFLTLLAVGAVGLLARRWAGGPAGGVAALLLLLNPAESWFGRYPAAELSVQLAVFGGVLLLFVATASQASWTAFAAGGVVGLSHLAKVDTFVVVLAVGVVLGAAWLAGRFNRPHAAFALGYALMLGHALAHVSLISTQYSYSVYARSLPSSTTLAALAVVGLVALAVIVARFRWLARRADALWVLAVGAVALLGLYGWYVRPHDPWRELPVLSGDFAAVARNRLHSLPRLGWYVPPLAILLAFTGFALAMRRVRSFAGALLLLLVALEAVVVFADPRITVEYPWAARRFVGLLVPGAILLAATQVGWLAGTVLSSRALLPAALAGVVALSSLGASLPFLGHREYAGSPALVRAIAEAVPANGVVLFDDDLVGWRLSTPLELLAERTSFVLFNRAADDELLRAPLAEWAAAGRPVYWLRVGEPGHGFEHWGRSWRLAGRWATGLREARSSGEAPPTTIGAFDVPVTLYVSS